MNNPKTEVVVTDGTNKIIVEDVEPGSDIAEVKRMANVLLDDLKKHQATKANG